MSMENGAVRGRTVRFHWHDGPTKGVTHEHVFHLDGTVEWRSAKPGNHGPREAERPPYIDEPISDGVRLVSYQSNSGYTLTVALNHRNGELKGVASSDQSWVPVHGRFEVVPA